LKGFESSGVRCLVLKFMLGSHPSAMWGSKSSPQSYPHPLEPWQSGHDREPCPLVGVRNVVHRAQ
jgi:hypothetical protein